MSRAQIQTYSILLYFFQEIFYPSLVQGQLLKLSGWSRSFEGFARKSMTQGQTMADYPEVVAHLKDRKY